MPGSAKREEAHDEQAERPDRPETTASSIGPLPERTFFPDHDSEDDELAGVPSDEDDESVFAFKRPDTARVRPLTGLGQTYQHQDTGLDQSPKHQDTEHASSSTLQDSFDQDKKGVDSKRHTHLANTPIFTFAQLNQVTSEEEQHEHAPSFTQSEVPVLLMTNTNQDSVPVSVRSPISTHGSMAEPLTNQNRSSYLKSGHGTSSRYPRRRSHQSGLSWKSGRTKRDSVQQAPDDDAIGMETIQGLSSVIEHRPKSAGTWNLSELGGATTVPDGKTTWGDGQGNISQDATTPHFTEETYFEEPQEEDSAYPEVRSSVSNIDDPDMPSLTIRSLSIGVAISAAMSAINTYAHYRDPGPYLSPLIVHIVGYPLGRFLAWILPIYVFELPRWLGGFEIDLNPGPFNIKEHTIMVIMANLSSPQVAGVQLWTACEVYLGEVFSDGFVLCFSLALRFGGLGMALLGTQMFIWPASLLWYYTLLTAANLNAFHADEVQKGGPTRFKVFTAVSLCALIYYFFPGFIITCLSSFSWICWMAPNNAVVNQLFGVINGLGMGILTFDWAQIASLGNPTTLPWWAIANLGMALPIVFWFICPLIYYLNVFETAYLPISSSGSFDRFGNYYENDKVLNPKDKTLNQEAYDAYSPIFMTSTRIMLLAMAFALITAAIVQTVFQHGSAIWAFIRHGKSEPDDIHNKLMRNYPETPRWLPFFLVIASFVVVIVAIAVEKVSFPIWGVVLAILLTMVYAIPGGYIGGRSGVYLSINTIVQLVPGYLMKGSALRNMIFKMMALGQFDGYLQALQNLKQGHYMKIPPRVNTFVQGLAIVITTIVSWGVRKGLFSIYDDMCQPNHPNGLTCSATRAMFNGGVMWGSIGPARLFGQDARYWFSPYMMIIGVVLPIIIWGLARRWPRSLFKYIDVSLILIGTSGIPPATGVNYVNFVVAGFLFQYCLRRYRPAFWSKYNYIIGAGLEFGTTMCALFIVLTLGLSGTTFQWAGNDIWKKTADFMGVPYKTAPPEGFGPQSGWH